MQSRSMSGRYVSPRCCGLDTVCLLVLLVLMAAVASVWAAGPERCIVCGMDVSRYPHTRYTVHTADGKKHVTCGVQCGLTLHLRLKDNWRSAIATDLFSNRPFDAKSGSYVFQSSVITDMSPGFITFRSKEHAEKFATGFGGQIVTYDGALDLWKRRMDKGEGR